MHDTPEPHHEMNFVFSTAPDRIVAHVTAPNRTTGFTKPGNRTDPYRKIYELKIGCTELDRTSPHLKNPHRWITVKKPRKYRWLRFYENNKVLL